MANSKAKGSNEEREFCKFLSKWLTGSEKPYQFWRTSNSGGTSTVVQENIHMTGDITAITPEARWMGDAWSFEIKTGYPDYSFDKHLKVGRKSTEVEDFWRQCLKDAERASKRPMLIYRKKGYPVVVGIDCDIKTLLKKKLTQEHINMHSVHLHFGADLRDIYFYNMDQFFELIGPSLLKGCLRA